MGTLQCGTLVVPLDYADPHGPTLPIAGARHPAEVPGDRIGSLVIDPGGPGVSGVDDMANELSVLTPGLLEDFDIVMFDPRGVERSDPVSAASAGQGRRCPTPCRRRQRADGAHRVVHPYAADVREGQRHLAGPMSGRSTPRGTWRPAACARRQRP